MNALPPLTITTARLTSTTVAETAPTAWSGAFPYAQDQKSSVPGLLGLIYVYKSLKDLNFNNTPASSPLWWLLESITYQVYSAAQAYVLGERCLNPTTHRVFESQSAANVGNALTLTTKWADVGPTNAWAMFDGLRSTPTIAANTLTVVLTPSKRVDFLALMNLVARRAQITITSGGNVVYTRDLNLNTRRIYNYYTFCFNPFSNQRNVLLLDLPPYTNAVITIKLTGVGDVKCGSCDIGQKFYIGKVEYGAENDAVNYSAITRDFAGDISVLTPRRNVPKTINTILIAKTRVSAVLEFRDANGGVPMVWSGIDDATDGYFDALLIKGIYKRFPINISYVNDSIASLEVEEI